MAISPFPHSFGLILTEDQAWKCSSSDGTFLDTLQDWKVSTLDGQTDFTCGYSHPRNSWSCLGKVASDFNDSFNINVRGDNVHCESLEGKPPADKKQPQEEDPGKKAKEEAERKKTEDEMNAQKRKDEQEAAAQKKAAEEAAAAEAAEKAAQDAADEKAAEKKAGEKKAAEDAARKKAEEDAAGPHVTPVDCRGTWHYSGCNSACKKTGTFTVTTPAQGSGLPCPPTTRTGWCDDGACDPTNLPSQFATLNRNMDGTKQTKKTVGNAEGMHSETRVLRLIRGEDPPLSGTECSDSSDPDCSCRPRWFADGTDCSLETVCELVSHCTQELTQTYGCCNNNSNNDQALLDDLEDDLFLSLGENEAYPMRRLTTADGSAGGCS